MAAGEREGRGGEDGEGGLGNEGEVLKVEGGGMTCVPMWMWCSYVK